jgi:hypothetical protein
VSHAALCFECLLCWYESVSLLRSLLMLLLLLVVHSATSSSGVILTKLNGSFCAVRANAATLTAPFFCEVEFLCDVNNTCPSGVDVRMPCPAGTHLPYRSAGTTDASCVEDSASVSLLLAQSDGSCFARVWCHTRATDVSDVFGVALCRRGCPRCAQTERTRTMQTSLQWRVRIRACL